MDFEGDFQSFNFSRRKYLPPLLKGGQRGIFIWGCHSERSEESLFFPFLYFICHSRESGNPIIYVVARFIGRFKNLELNIGSCPIYRVGVSLI
jgi:hypothetical protein